MHCKSIYAVQWWNHLCLLSQLILSVLDLLLHGERLLQQLLPFQIQGHAGRPQQIYHRASHLWGGHLHAIAETSS